MNEPFLLAAANANKAELLYVWEQATPEAKVIILCLLIFSITACTVMIAKVLQMRRAKRLNLFFNTEFRTQKNVLDVFDRRVQADGCPLFKVYQAGSLELDTRQRPLCLPGICQVGQRRRHLGRNRHGDCAIEGHLLVPMQERVE